MYDSLAELKHFKSNPIRYTQRISKHAFAKGSVIRHLTTLPYHPGELVQSFLIRTDERDREPC